MADLPLVKSLHIKEIVSNDRDITIAPGKGGGTNILFIKDPSSFHVKYHGSSFLTHCNIAKERGHTVHIYDSFMTGTDIDEPQDLVEIFIHGHGLSKDYIERKFGTELTNGRVKLCHIP
jgi:2-phospho-L-lactate guanylyltransferase